MSKQQNGKPKQVVSGLVDFLSETGQQNLLPEVTDALQDLVEESTRAKVITVTSIVPLSDKQLSKVKDTISQLVNTDLPLENKVDKKILGGFTVRVGEWFLDASIQYYLNNIKKILAS